MTYVQAYQKLFDNFVKSNNLDLSDDYWPAEVKAEFARRFKELQIAYGVTPL